ELPAEVRYVDKCARNFELIHNLIKRGQAAGELDGRFDSKELAFGIYGQLNIYLMAHLLMPDCKLNRETAERIVKLFLAGAGAKRRPELRENMRETLLTAAVGVACCLLFGGCKKTAGAARAGGFPPVQVIAVEARRQPVTESLSLIGSLAANEMVEIKAETDGTVQEIPFNEGQRVEKGQLLIQLDETKFATALAEAEGNFKLSQANFERAKQLFADKLISQQEIG